MVKIDQYKCDICGCLYAMEDGSAFPPSWEMVMVSRPNGKMFTADVCGECIARLAEHKSYSLKDAAYTTTAHTIPLKSVDKSQYEPQYKFS